MTKLRNYLLNVFSSNTGTTGAFGSMKAKHPHLSQDVDVIQTDGWKQGWKGAVIGQGAPPAQEWNGILYVLSQSIAYLKQQGGLTLEWNTKTTYYNGSVVSKIASSALLGDDANKITLVYRSLEDDNIGNTLPNDFISDDHWAFVDAVQPQNLNKLDFTGAIGSINQFDADETAVPINWGICDGRAITMPDGSTQNTPDLQDKFLIAASDDKEKGTIGGRWDHNTDGYALTIAQMPSHYHTYSRQSGEWRVEGGSSRIADITYGTFTTNNTGGNQEHDHSITNFVSPYYSVYYIRRMF